MDTPELETTAGPAFDWLCQELDLPNEAARLVLRKAFVELSGEGSRNAARKILAIWPDDAHWPSGEAWLSSGESRWEGTPEDLMMLLHMRHARVAYRIYRDAQVRELIHPDSPSKWPGRMYVLINSINLDGDGSETNICGLPYAHVMSVADGLKFMEEPAHAHPECHCSISALTERDFLRKYAK